MINVLVVDDHSLFRRGVVAVIGTQPDMKVVAEAANGAEALEAARKFRPKVVLMDLSMPQVNGVEATRLLVQEMPETNVLILTVSDKDEDLFNAIRAGAKGYLLKGADPEELIRAMTHVAEGGVIISPLMAPKLLAELETVPKPPAVEAPELSPRERELLELIAQGLTDKEIAERLFISVNTAKTHLKNILAKLHFKSRAQIAAYQAGAKASPPANES